jgi:hypothetical protein
MILAHKILLPSLEKKDPDLEDRIRVPETWYLNSGVSELGPQQPALSRFRAGSGEHREGFLRIEEQFARTSPAVATSEDPEEIGQHPIIIRSSSMPRTFRPGLFRKVPIGVSY